MQVETLEALHNFDSIASAADAIILSRGNLGLDVAPEKTAVVQKAAINRCNLLVGVCPAVCAASGCVECAHGKAIAHGFASLSQTLLLGLKLKGETPAAGKTGHHHSPGGLYGRGAQMYQVVLTSPHYTSPFHQLPSLPCLACRQCASY